jgi:DNA-directed RNA polymerase specialized sigma24 family protein
MADPAAINGVELEELIRKAAHRDKKAVNTLLYCPWTTGLLKSVADWSRWQFNVDGEEVRDYVFDQIRDQVEPPKNSLPEPWLKNDRQLSWADCLTEWSFAVGKNRSLNIIRHRGVEGRHVKEVEHENTIRKEHGVSIIKPSAPILSPEEEMERKEQEGLKSKIHEKARRVFDSSTEEEMRIASLWIEGKTLKQIAGELGSSIETVRRKLKKLQQAIVEEVGKDVVEEVGEKRAVESGVMQFLEDIVNEREDLEELLAVSAQGNYGNRPAPHAGA